MGVLMVNAEHGVGGVLSAARVERAHDARGPARLGSAGRRLGTPPEALAARGGCRAPRLRGPRLPGRRRHRLDPAPTVLVGDPRPHRLGLPRRRDAVPAGRGSAGDPHRAHRPLRLRRAGRRRGRARVARHTRADRGPDRRHPRRDRARGHAPRRAAEAPPARARLRLAIRGARCSATRPRSARPGLLLHTLHDLHPAFRVSKIHATVPWGLLSSALTCAAWVLVFVLVDVLGFRRWPRSFAIAGENPLVAYLMAPFLLSLFALATPLFGGTNVYAGSRRDDRHRPRPLGGLRLARRAPQRLAAVAGRARPAVAPVIPRSSRPPGDEESAAIADPSSFAGDEAPRDDRVRQRCSRIMPVI